LALKNLICLHAVFKLKGGEARHNRLSHAG